MTRFETAAHRLGRTPRARFVTAYILAGGFALGIFDFGQLTTRPVLVWTGVVLAAAATFVLVTVTTWYRRENIGNAAIMLALGWTLARLIGLAVTTLLTGLRGDGFWLGFGVVGGLFGLPVAVLVWLIISAALVAVLRRVRPPVVPLSVDAPGVSNGGGTPTVE